MWGAKMVREWCEVVREFYMTCFDFLDLFLLVVDKIYFLFRQQYKRVTPKFSPKRQQSAPELQMKTYS